MRRKKRFLLFGMLLMLTACGRPGKADTITQIPDYDWKTKGFVLRDTVGGMSYGETSVNESLLYTADFNIVEYLQPENVSSGGAFCFGTYESGMCICDIFFTDDDTYFYSVQKFGNEGDAFGITVMTPDMWGVENGRILAMDVMTSEQYVYWVATEVQKDAAGDMGPEHYYAIYTNADGIEQRRVDIIDVLREQSIWKKRGDILSYMGSDINCDSHGNIYIRDWEKRAVYLLNQDGQLAAQYTYDATRDNLIGSIHTDDGEVVFACESNAGMEFVWLDPDSREVKKLAVAEAFDHVRQWYGLWGNILYYATSKEIIGLNVSSGEKQTLFRLDENEIQNVNRTSFIKTSEGAFLLVTEQARRYIITLSTDPPQTQAKFQVVNISAENRYLKGRVVSFSRENPSLEVEYVEAYREKMDAARVLMEMANGNGPAIAYISRADLENLQAVNALADLNQILSAENREALIPGVISMGTYGGSLVGAPVTIDRIDSISTCWDYCPGDTWTTSEILRVIEDHPEISGLFIGETGFGNYYENMRVFLSKDIEHSSFIKNGKCNFDGPEFRNLLETIKKKAIEENIPHYIWTDFLEMTKEGQFLGVVEMIYDWKYFCYEKQVWGEKMHAVGYPSERGSGSYLIAEGVLVVNQNAANREEVRRLVNHLFNLESQRLIEEGLISVRLDAANLPIKYDTYSGYVWVNNDGSYTLLKEVYDETYLEEYRHLLETAVPIPVSSEEIFGIIWEEAEPYLYSDKSLEVVCDAIQRRVQLYLDERN